MVEKKMSGSCYANVDSASLEHSYYMACSMTVLMVGTVFPPLYMTISYSVKIIGITYTS